MIESQKSKVKFKQVPQKHHTSKQACWEARAAAFPPAYMSGAGDELSSLIRNASPSTI
jgi:hypothetical protein